MARPDAYDRLTRFTGTEAGRATALLGVNLDKEFDAINTTVGEIATNLEAIQRADLQLANNTVGVEQLSDVALALMTGGLTVRGSWGTATEYSAGDLYVYANAVYLVIGYHVSSTIATDLSLGHVTGPIFDPAAALSASGNSSTSVRAAEAIAQGDFVHVYDDAGAAKMVKMDPADATKFANAFVLANVASGDFGTVYFRGLNTGVVPAAYGRAWAHETAKGSYQVTAPNPLSTSAKFIQVLGTAAPGGVHFDPQTEILL